MHADGPSGPIRRGDPPGRARLAGSPEAARCICVHPRASAAEIPCLPDLARWSEAPGSAPQRAIPPSPACNRFCDKSDRKARPIHQRPATAALKLAFSRGFRSPPTVSRTIGFRARGDWITAPKARHDAARPIGQNGHGWRLRGRRKARSRPIGVRALSDQIDLDSGPIASLQLAGPGRPDRKAR